MKLFAGLSQTDYQDLLRAVGALIDTQGLRDVRFWEHEEGIVLQGHRSPSEDTYETILLTDDDLSALLIGAYRRRGEPDPPGRRSP